MSCDSGYSAAAARYRRRNNNQRQGGANRLQPRDDSGHRSISDASTNSNPIVFDCSLEDLDIYKRNKDAINFVQDQKKADYIRCWLEQQQRHFSHNFEFKFTKTTVKKN